MSTVTIPVKANEHPQIRALNIFRDLPPVADLIELCFSSTMDHDGQQYLADMRRASRDEGVLQWASRVTNSASLPLTGFVWEENGRIVGNVSLIPFRDRGSRIFLLANVAVHPDYRRRGIARILTQRAIRHSQEKKAAALWLHVRDDNPGAVMLYESLGFREIARRTTWTANPDPRLPMPDSDIRIVPRQARHWSQQWDWLRRLHPEGLNWYSPLNFNTLKPGLASWFYWLFMDYGIHQWSAVLNNQLLATLTWMPRGGRSESLYAALPLVRYEMGRGEAHSEALTQLLLHVRHSLPSRVTLSMEYPAGEMTEAITTAGFTSRRTLIWMRR